MISSRKRARRLRRAKVLIAIASVGVLPNHLQCNRLVEDGIASGITGFVSQLTLDLLTVFLRPFSLGTNGGGNNNANGNDDPFEPPVQG